MSIAIVNVNSQLLLERQDQWVQVIINILESCKKLSLFWIHTYCNSKCLGVWEKQELEVAELGGGRRSWLPANGLMLRWRHLFGVQSVQFSVIAEIHSFLVFWSNYFSMIFLASVSDYWASEFNTYHSL